MRKRTVTHDDYAKLFEHSKDGQDVLEDLVNRFGDGHFVSGGQEGDRQTAFNLGARQVIDFILSQINKSNGVN